jgi:Family of unknown function (DUF6263)
MKKLSLQSAVFLLAACIIVLGNVGCKSSESYDLKMRLAKGDVFAQNMSMKMDMKMMAMDMKMQTESGSSFEVLKNEASEKELKMTYTKMHTSMNMSGMPDRGTNMDSAMNEPAKNIIGKSVVMKLSKDNAIIDVAGFDEILNNGNADSATQEMMKKMFSKEALGNLFGMMFSMYPKKPVKIGETWTGETNTSIGGIDMKIAVKYKLLAVKDGLADIDVDGIIGGKGNMATGGMNIEINMNGSQKGVITIKTADGYLKTSTYKMDVKADMEIMGQKMPMPMTAEYELKGE